MSVNAVTFSTWLETQPAEVKNLSLNQQVEKFFEFKNSSSSTENPKGTVVEHKEDEVVDPQAQQARANANAAANDEVAAMKAASQQPEGNVEAKPAAEQPVAEQPAAEKKGVYRPQVLPKEMDEKLDGIVAKTKHPDKPFYKNDEAQKAYKAEIKESYTKALQQKYVDLLQAEAAKEGGGDPEKIKQLQSDMKLAEKVGDKVADAIGQYAKIGDKIDNTVMYTDSEAKRAAKAELGDEATYTRWKEHKPKYIKEHNAELHRIMKEKNCSEHEAFMELTKDVSGDFIIEKNELETIASRSSNDKLRTYAAKRELEKAGFKINDNFWADLGAAALVGAASGLTAASIPIIAEAVATATATATARAIDETGKILAEATETATKTASGGGTIFPWQNGVAGGTVAGVLAGLLFGDNIKEDNILKDDPSHIFNDAYPSYKDRSFGDKKTTAQVKMVLGAIDELDLTNEEKQQLLIDAAGKNGERMLSSKELMLALFNGMEKAKIKPPVLDDDIEIEDEDFDIEPIEIDLGPDEPIHVEPLKDKLSVQQNVQEYPSYEIKYGNYPSGIISTLYGVQYGTPEYKEIANKVYEASGYTRNTNIKVKDKFTLPDVEVNGKTYKADLDKANLVPVGKVVDNGLKLSKLNVVKRGEYWTIIDANGKDKGYGRFRTKEAAVAKINSLENTEYDPEHDK